MAMKEKKKGWFERTKDALGGAVRGMENLQDKLHQSAVRREERATKRHEVQLSRLKREEQLLTQQKKVDDLRPAEQGMGLGSGTLELGFGGLREPKKKKDSLL